MSNKVNTVVSVFIQLFASVKPNYRFTFAENVIQQMVAHVVKAKTPNPAERVAFLNSLGFALGAFTTSTEHGGYLPLLSLEETRSRIENGAALVLSEPELGIYSLYNGGLADASGGGDDDWSDNADDDTDEPVGLPSIEYCNLYVVNRLAWLTKTGELRTETVWQTDCCHPILCLVKA